MRPYTPFALLVLLSASASLAVAQAPATLSHQGVVEQAGNRVTATLPFTFRLYTVASGGSALWTETHPSVAITDGLYGVTLGSVTSLTGVDFGQPLWLDVVVNGAAQSPRTALTSVPSALTLRAGAQMSGNLGDSDQAILYVHNTSLAANSHGVRGTSDSGEGYGGYFEGSSGVYGTGPAYGGVFEGANTGVVGSSAFSAGLGGWFEGGIGVSAGALTNTGADLVLRGFSTVFDDGRLFSDPNYPNSDLWLESHDAVVVVLDRDNNTADSDFYVEVNGTNVFNVDDSGTVTVNGTVVHSSDVHRKEHIVPVDPAAVLAEVAAMELAEWSYRGEEARHLGPMAQDFYAAFGLGETDTGIATVDADGVALAAIQALHQRVQEQETLIQTLLARMEALEQEPRTER